MGEVALDESALSEMNTIPENAMTQDELSTLVGLLQRANLVSALSGEGPFTVFAPINSAFEGIDASSMSMEELQETLKYHVVPGEYSADDLVDGTELQTLSGDNLRITASGASQGQLQADNVNIIYTDIESSNGVIHLLSYVLNPDQGN